MNSNTSRSAKPKVQIANPESEVIEIFWDEVARLLFRERRIESGLWHLGLRLDFVATTAKSLSNPADGRPVAIVRMANVTLSPVRELGPMVFDASPPKAKTAPVGVKRAEKRSKASQRPRTAGAMPRSST